MSDSLSQPSLFYHLGVRESFSMTNNIILYCNKQESDLQLLKVGLVGLLALGGEKKPLQNDIQLRTVCSSHFFCSAKVHLTCRATLLVYSDSLWLQSTCVACTMYCFAECENISQYFPSFSGKVVAQLCSTYCCYLTAPCSLV